MDKLDTQLWELQRQCNLYKNTDCLADWVLYAISRYIVSGKATRQFENDFCNLSQEQLLKSIKHCLNGNRSDAGIIKSMKSFMRMVKNDNGK